MPSMTVEDLGHGKDLDHQPPPSLGTDKTDGKKLVQLAPLQDSSRSYSDENASIYSADNENERSRSRLLHPVGLRHHSTSPAPSPSFRAKCRSLWIANKGLVLVLVAQLFGALMNVTTRLLETSGEPLNTFQVPRGQWHHSCAGRKLTTFDRSCLLGWLLLW